MPASQHTPRSHDSSLSNARPAVVRASMLTATLLLGALPVSATTYTWTGNGTTANWSDTTKWSGGSYPVSGVDTVISFSTSQNTNATNDLGTIQLSGLSMTNSNTKTLTVGGSAANNLDFVKNSSNAGPTLTFTKNGSGSMTFSAPFTVTDSLNIVSSGTDTGTVVVSGAIVNNGGIVLTGTGATTVRLGSGVISGAGGLTVNGSYTVNLTGANTYTGATTVSSGKLSLGASNRISDSSNLVMSGGTFATGGFSETLGTLTLSGDSIFDMGAGTSALVFADSSSSLWGDSISLGIINFDVGVDSIRFGTDVHGLTESQLGKITINGLGAALDASGYLIVATVPEPASATALLGACALVATAGRRRRRAA